MVFRISFYLSLSLLIFSSATYGFVSSQGKSKFDPSILKINEDDYLGNTVPDIEMTDINGNPFRLSKYADRPVVLSIIYYSCPHTCKILNDGLADALKNTGLSLGDDYNVITVSFDDKDTSEDAMKFRDKLKIRTVMPEGMDKWIFATAAKDEIKRLTEAVGYRFFYTAEDKMFVHPNVYVFLSPERKITRYIFGLFPVTSDIRLSILESAQGKTGKTPLLNTAILACFKYDPSIGGYKLNIPFIFGMFGLTFGVMTGVVVFVYSRKMKKQKKMQL